jgi:hypothetical protein
LALIFDPSTKIITLDVTSITAQEIYSDWVDWVFLSDNAKYLPAFRSVGGDDLGGGIFIPPYYFLSNGWRVRPMEAAHDLSINGNLVVDGGGIPVISTLGTFQVNVQYTVPVQAQAFSAGGANLTAADVANAVWAQLIENGKSAEDIMRIKLAGISGDRRGVGTSTEEYLSEDGSKPRITLTPTDENGNGTTTTDGTV